MECGGHGECDDSDSDGARLKSHAKALAVASPLPYELSIFKQ
jgi:hypothetical protein